MTTPNDPARNQGDDATAGNPIGQAFDAFDDWSKWVTTELARHGQHNYGESLEGWWNETSDLEHIGLYSLMCGWDRRALAERDALAARLSEAEQRDRAALELLGELRDLQNGPPLPKYEPQWTVVMERITAALATSPASAEDARPAAEGGE